MSLILTSTDLADTWITPRTDNPNASIVQQVKLVIEHYLTKPTMIRFHLNQNI